MEEVSNLSKIEKIEKYLNKLVDVFLSGVVNTNSTVSKRIDKINAKERELLALVDIRYKKNGGSVYLYTDETKKYFQVVVVKKHTSHDSSVRAWKHISSSNWIVGKFSK